MLFAGPHDHFLYNCTLTKNTVTGGLFLFNYTGVLTVKNCIISGNDYSGINEFADISIDNPDQDIVGSNNCIGVINVNKEQYYSSTNDLARGTDPLLADSTPETFDDLKLQALSPCIGTGVLIAGVEVLDPAVTTRPTPKAGSESTVIGAFAPS